MKGSSNHFHRGFMCMIYDDICMYAYTMHDKDSQYGIDDCNSHMCIYIGKSSNIGNKYTTYIFPTLYVIYHTYILVIYIFLMT